MFNFFADESCATENGYIISGSDFNHIKNVLRIRIGETLLVSCCGRSDLCSVEEFTQGEVIVSVVKRNYKDTELPVNIYLFQGLPKSDKMELIIQKTVELGVTNIIPVEMSRCIAKIDDKKKGSKQVRWQSIAESAAKQSKRNVIPEVHGIVTYRQALQFAKDLDVVLIPYENKDGMKSTKDALDTISKQMSVGIFIGPEGGFDESEIELAEECRFKTLSLGKRILRTETAAITAVGMCMLHAEMNLIGE